MLHRCVVFCADIPGIKYLVQEWEGGIYLAVNNVLVSPPVRTPPVKQLEAEMGKDPWRSGKAMRVIIMSRKAIWYAYTRRLYGHTLSPAAAAAGGNSGASAAAGQGGSSAGGQAAADSAAAGDAAAAAGGGGSSNAVEAGSSSRAAEAGSSSSSAAGMPPEEAITDLEVLAR